MNRVLLALVFGVLAGAGISACINVDREGAPCDTDDNCPRSQYCDLTNKCVELTPALPADTACQLALVSLTQKFSACVGGKQQTWLEEIFPQQICGTLAASQTAGRITYAPMQLKVCRAALLNASCGDVATRKPGQQLSGCPMYTGTVAQAGSCATDKDCAAGWCDTSTGCLGTCRGFVPEGGSCATATDLCAPGAACFNGACRSYITGGGCDGGPCQPYSNFCNGNQQCVPRLPAGTANCDYSGAGYFCQQTLNCVGPAVFATKFCQPPAQQGELCQGFTNACDKFTICTQTDGGNVCAPVPGPGGGCFATPPQNAQDLVLYCRQSRCNGFSCVSYLGLGAGCGDNAACGPLARCVNGACRSEFCP